MPDQELNPDLDESDNITHVVKKTDSPEYYRANAKATREDWATLKIVPLSVLLPAKYREYVKATADVLAASEMIRLVEEMDVNALDILSNKRLAEKTSRAALVDALAKMEEEKASDSIVSKVEPLLQLHDVKTQARLRVADYNAIGNTEMVMYWYAKEYALTKYIDAAFQLLNLRKTLGMTPDQLL